ncbi:hypothetical protein pEaSNUABM6_00057 [Erwinia phage pEa_SNUABM_6]|nr:hypothetical protein pEaSNUABM6_00057 [Erwinia phage pEa_SNUABM_6]
MKLDTTSLFKRRDSRPITYQEAHDELLSTYDSILGLETGENNISVSDFENPINQSLYEIWATTYVREGIRDLFGYDLDTWLDRPRWKLMKHLEIAKRRRAELDNAKKGAIPPELEKELKGRI